MCKVLDEVENRGISRGISKGISRGISIGEQNATKVINYLWENGRGEDAKKAADDKDFFDKLQAELMPVLNLAE